MVVAASPLVLGDTSVVTAAARDEPDIIGFLRGDDARG
jgi:hypothetical protein